MGVALGVGAGAFSSMGMGVGSAVITGAAVGSGVPSRERLRLASGVAEHSAELDAYIAKYAKNWRFERISRVASAIMRTAMFEMLYMPEIPYKAAVNEAINLGRGYEDEETVRFINGVLAGFIRGELNVGDQ